MNNLEYRNGTWTEIEDPLNWTDDDEKWEAALERNGWNNFADSLFGIRDYCSVSVYTPKELYGVANGYKYFVDFLLLSSEARQVFVPSYADLLQLLAEVAPIIQMGITTYQQDEKERKDAAKNSR